MKNRIYAIVLVLILTISPAYAESSPPPGSDRTGERDKIHQQKLI